MSKKVFWFINQYIGSPKHGMEFRHYYMARSLQALGHQVIIFSGSYSHLYKSAPEINYNGQEEVIDGIKYIWLKNRKYDRPASLSRVLNMRDFVSSLKKLDLNKIEKPDVLLVSSPSLFPIVLAEKWKRKFKAQLIFEVRDIWPLTLQQLGGLKSWHPLILYMRYFEKFAYRKSDLVISVLPGLLQHTGKLLKSEKFTCIPNGIYIHSDENNKQIVNNFIPDDNKFNVVYVGTLGKANALEYLVEAAKMLKENKRIHFTIVGSGSEEIELKKLAVGLSNIQFTGSVDKSQVPSILKQANCAYIGWRNEPMYRFGISPNKLYDYMYAAKPIVHSVNAFNDLVADSNCGLSVQPENPNAIVDAILKLSMMSETDLNNLGENGKKRVLAEFTYNKLAERLIELCERGK